MTAGMRFMPVTPLAVVEPDAAADEIGVVEPTFWTDFVNSPLIWAVVALALGLYLVLPRGTRRGTRVGTLALAIGLILLAWQVPAVMHWPSRTILAILSITTVLSCVAAITFRNPMYCALWFGVALLSISALFLYQGAQFLSVATITVYAGAILVTFLFVLMLAQPAGQAAYDRVSWEAALAATTGAVIIGLVFGVVQTTVAEGGDTSTSVAATESTELPAANARSVDELDGQRSGRERNRGVLTSQHVATLGRELLGRHLVSMQIAAALMLAALVGAVAIVTQGKKTHDAQRPANPPVP